MREKLKTLSAAELKELAKGQGLKGTSSMRKQQLIDWLAERWEQETGQKGAAAAESAAAEQSAPAEAAAPESSAGPGAAAGTAEEQSAPAEAAAPEGPAGPGTAAESAATEQSAPAEAAAPESSAGPGASVESAVRRGRPAGRRSAATEEKNAAGQVRRDGGRTAGRRPMKQDSGAAAPGRPVRKTVRVQKQRPAAGTAEAAERQRRPAGEEREKPMHPAAEAGAPAVAERPGRQQTREVTEKKERSLTGEARGHGALPQQSAEGREPQREETPSEHAHLPAELQNAADRGPLASGILEVMQDGYGFLRSANYLPGDDDVYVSPSQIRRFNMRTGDVVTGVKRIRSEKEKFAALLYVSTINGLRPAEFTRRPNFEDMTPIFPNKRIHLDVPGASIAMRIVDLVSPIGMGQRGMIVSPPKAGKTTLLKQIAKVISDTMPDMHIIILLIDERPEEVTDIREFIQGPQVEVIYSTFDKDPEQHKRVSEMVIERAKRLVEQHRDVIILLDSITRLARAYNLTIVPSGRTLSGGLDPAALYMPKRFFGAARNMREGGSLTILATALVETGSRMDDVVFEEFKGTGNMELVLDRKLSERRIFPAIDIVKSGTRRDDLLLSKDEQEVLDLIHRMTNGARPEDSVERILNRFAGTRNNADLVRYVKFAHAI